MTAPPPNHIGRREALVTMAGTVSLTALAGCTGLWDQTGATDVIVHNATAASTTVSITITAGETEEPHTSRTVTIEGGDTLDPVNHSKLPTNARYTVEVSVKNGPSETFEWTDVTVERSPLWVILDGSANIRFLLQAG
jgi:hypothetical protein